MLKKIEEFAKVSFYLLVIGAILFMVTFKHSSQFIAADVIINVTGKDQIASVKGSASTKFVYANNSTYEVADSYLEMTFNSRDRYGRLQVGKTYRVKTRGVRFPLLSMQPNIVRIYEQIPDTTTTAIPVTAPIVPTVPAVSKGWLGASPEPSPAPVVIPPLKPVVTDVDPDTTK